MSIEKELRALERKVDKLSSANETDIAVFRNDMGYIKRQLDEIKNLVANNYVGKDEFEPVKKIVYGLVSLILTGVASAMLYLVLR